MIKASIMLDVFADGVRERMNRARAVAASGYTAR